MMVCVCVCVCACVKKTQRKSVTHVTDSLLHHGLPNVQGLKQLKWAARLGTPPKKQKVSFNV